jgi:hypothetical protein
MKGKEILPTSLTNQQLAAMMDKNRSLELQLEHARELALVTESMLKQQLEQQSVMFIAEKKVLGLKLNQARHLAVDASSASEQRIAILAAEKKALEVELEQARQLASSTSPTLSTSKRTLRAELQQARELALTTSSSLDKRLEKVTAKKQALKDKLRQAKTSLKVSEQQSATVMAENKKLVLQLKQASETASTLLVSTNQQVFTFKKEIKVLKATLKIGAKADFTTRLRIDELKRLRAENSILEEELEQARELIFRDISGANSRSKSNSNSNSGGGSSSNSNNNSSISNSGNNSIAEGAIMKKIRKRKAPLQLGQDVREEGHVPKVQKITGMVAENVFFSNGSNQQWITKSLCSWKYCLSYLLLALSFSLTFSNLLFYPFSVLLQKKQDKCVQTWDAGLQNWEIVFADLGRAPNQKAESTPLEKKAARWNSDQEFDMNIKGKISEAQRDILKASPGWTFCYPLFFF